MMHNEISKAMGKKGTYHGESVKCPYCESTVDYPSLETECPTCNQLFHMEGFEPVGFDDPTQREPTKAVSGVLMNEAVSDIAKGKKGWKYVVCTYRNPDSAKDYVVYWAMEGAPELFKNADRVDLQEAGKRAMIGDKMNKKEFQYNPDMDAVGGVKDIKKLMSKYDLEPEGYSVSSFVISPDGTKVYTGMDVRSATDGSAKTFYSAVSRCIGLQKELQQKYKPEDYPSGSALQMAINNFIRDNPLILCWTKDNLKSRQAGYLKELWKAPAQQTEAVDLPRRPMELDKKLISDINDLKVFTVNGTYVRNHHDIDFTMGGTHVRYDWIPDGEVWVEDNQEVDDMIATVNHEVVEYNMMKYADMNYDEAHEKANQAEVAIRKFLETMEGA